MNSIFQKLRESKGSETIPSKSSQNNNTATLTPDNNMMCVECGNPMVRCSVLDKQGLVCVPCNIALPVLQEYVYEKDN
jgi:hypothetical protein